MTLPGPGAASQRPNIARSKRPHSLATPPPSVPTTSEGARLLSSPDLSRRGGKCEEQQQPAPGNPQNPRQRPGVFQGARATQTRALPSQEEPAADLQHTPGSAPLLESPGVGRSGPLSQLRPALGQLATSAIPALGVLVRLCREGDRATPPGTRVAEQWGGGLWFKRLCAGRLLSCPGKAIGTIEETGIWPAPLQEPSQAGPW